MGPITDHAFEHLGPADQMIARTRRRILRAARATANDGAPAPGRDDPTVWWGARSGFFIADGGPTDWQARYAAEVAKATRPVPLPAANSTPAAAATANPA